MGGTTSLIHTCRDQQREETGLVRAQCDGRTDLKQCRRLNQASVVKKINTDRPTVTCREERPFIPIGIRGGDNCFDRLDSDNSKAARNLKGFHLKPI